MIKIVPCKKESLHDYLVSVELTSTKAIVIDVDMGLKPGQSKPCINVPATGALSTEQFKKLHEGLAIAADLLTGKLGVVSPDYEFKPTYR